MILFLWMVAATKLKREFRYVPYGESFEASDSRPIITCDGRVPGAVDLELTHWTGNETPDRLYADTSTEMALMFAKQRDDFEQFNDALLLNNHFDTDGVLTVWACLDPDTALQYESLLTEGAAAGDFGEWSSDNGVKLDCLLGEFCYEEIEHFDEEIAYRKCFEELPSILKDLSENEGMSYEDLWKPGFEDALSGWDQLQSGEATIRKGPGRIAILEGSAGQMLSCYALDRGLKANGIWKDTTRVLRVADSDSDSRNYLYEKVGHGWVAKTITRHQVAQVDGDALAEAISSKLSTNWSAGGSDLVSICEGEVASENSVDEIAELLHSLDSGSWT